MFVSCLSLFYKAWCRFYMHLCKYSFVKCGSNVLFNPSNSTFSYKTISIGNKVSIGDNAYFVAAISHIYIGNNIAIAPNVTIRGGNHSFHIKGKFLIDYKIEDKLPSDDAPVYIQDDCWIGCNVTILKGVTISRGCIVAAGAVVNKSIPPYSIVGGIPARVIKYRWSIDDIVEHEKLLYKEDERLTIEELMLNRYNIIDGQ